MPRDFNQNVIEEFRANNGRVGGPFEGGRLLLLTTTGARTGAPHTTPLGYLPDGPRKLVIASAAGAPTHPDWYHNLRANPHVTVEDGIFTYNADAVITTGAERDRLFARAAEADAGWAAYQAMTARVLPVVALHPTTAGAPNATSPGEALTLIHGAFRTELARIRRELAESGPGLGAQLRVNCLTVCLGLEHHHHGEDAHMFPALARRHPDIAPVLARLRHEHRRMQHLLEQLRGLVIGTDPTAVLALARRLTADLEAHLDYEEEQLIPLL